MKNKISAHKKIASAALLVFALTIGTAAQTVAFGAGDRVQTPDGKTGYIEAFKNDDMAKVRFSEAAGDTKYYMLKDLQLIVPPKPTRLAPVEIFRVGDIVIHPNDPNRQSTIDSISGDTVIVRTGPGKYNVYTAKIEELYSLKTWERMKDEENRQKLVRAEFADEAEPFMKTVNILAHTFDPKFQQGGGGFISEAATYEEWRKDLEALAAVCRKYPNLTNDANPPSYWKDVISKNPADVCRLAEQRTSLLQKMRNKVGDMSADNEVRSWAYKLDQAVKNSEGWIEDELQMLLYERAAWETTYLKNLKKQYANTGAVWSPEVLKPLDEFAAQTKAKIESDAAQRDWEKPNFTDAALEALAKRRLAADFPGAQILKTGMTFTTWKEMDTKSLIGSDSTWKYYKITPGAYRYKMGLALVKMPNRPGCQIREFQVTQQKAGAGFGAARASLGGAGIFVKCP